MLWCMIETLLTVFLIIKALCILIPPTVMREVLAGAILAIMTTIVLDDRRRPKLSLELVDPQTIPYPKPRPAEVRFLLVKLTNAPLPRLLQWMSRAAAQNARGTVTFHQLDSDQSLFKRPMRFRWSSSDEPLPLVGQVGPLPARLWDQNSLLRDSVVDVYPGESEAFGIAAKIEDDADCYAWSNENYAYSPKWRHPGWRIPPGRYRVKVSVSSSGRKRTARYLLLNDGPQSEFRLEEMPE